MGKTPSEVELAQEAVGLPRKSQKYTNALALGLGTIASVGGGVNIIMGLYTRNWDMINEGTTLLSCGLGMEGYASGHYLRQGGFEPPPKKPQWRSVREWARKIFSNLTPAPVLNPKPVKVTAQGIYV